MTRYQAEDGDITIALTGESMISQGLRTFRERRFLELRELLRTADARFTNAEMLFHNYEDPPGYLAGTYMLSGTYMRCDPRLIGDMQWLGINLVACANNHAYDFGENGVLTNIRYLDLAGMAYAGTGAHLAAATEPTYLDTPNGRVALVAATSSADNAVAVRAGEQRRDFKGRPGANVIDFDTEWVVDQPAFEALQRISEGLGWADEVRRAPESSSRVLADSDSLVHFLDQTTSEASPARFVRGKAFGRRTFINQADLERNLQSVADARRMADWVIFSVHNHEHGVAMEEPADHIRVLAHAVIDAGADMFIGHGPHEDRGIEIYHGRPILYSLGNFICENDLVLRQPHESYEREDLGPYATPADFYDTRSASGTRGQRVEPIRWESAVAMVSFEKGQLSRLSLHPVDLGFGRARPQQGRPMLAERQVAGSVFRRFQRLSEPFGTTIIIEGDIAAVRLPLD